jgi:hypothetical protein
MMILLRQLEVIVQLLQGSLSSITGVVVDDPVQVLLRDDIGWQDAGDHSTLPPQAHPRELSLCRYLERVSGGFERSEIRNLVFLEDDGGQ